MRVKIKLKKLSKFAIMGTEKKRLSARIKTELVLRLLQGESVEKLSREIHQPVSELMRWKDHFINAGSQSFKRDQESSQLNDAQKLIGRQSMLIELYKKKLKFIRLSPEL